MLMLQVGACMWFLIGMPYSWKIIAQLFKCHRPSMIFTEAMMC